jgi:hypothetical protein
MSSTCYGYKARLEKLCYAHCYKTVSLERIESKFREDIGSVEQKINCLAIEVKCWYNKGLKIPFSNFFQLNDKIFYSTGESFRSNIKCFAVYWRFPVSKTTMINYLKCHLRWKWFFGVTLPKKFDVHFSHLYIFFHKILQPFKKRYGLNILYTWTHFWSSFIWKDYSLSKIYIPGVGPRPKILAPAPANCYGCTDSGSAVTLTVCVWKSIIYTVWHLKR